MSAAHSKADAGRMAYPSPSTDMEAAKETAGEAFLAWYPKLAFNDEGDTTDEVVGGAWGITSWCGGSWNEPEFLSASGSFFDDDFEFAAEPTHWLPLPPDIPEETVRAALVAAKGAGQ
ncbi:MAG: hypothetical protein JZU55_02675 [Afipia sp.]|nr:hypothetical protein [Afipia sp.]